MPKPPPEWLTTGLAIVLFALASWVGSSFAGRLNTVEADHQVLKVSTALAAAALCRIERRLDHQSTSGCDGNAGR